MVSLNIDVIDPLTGELVHGAVELVAQTAYVPQVFMLMISKLYDRNRPTFMEDCCDMVWAASQGVLLTNFPSEEKYLHVQNCHVSVRNILGINK